MPLSITLVIRPSQPKLKLRGYRRMPRRDDGVVVRGWESRGELFRYRCGSCANVFSLRYICPRSRVSERSGFLLRAARECEGRRSCGRDVPDGVTSSQSDPLRNRSVLLLGFRKLLLRAEGLVALFVDSYQPFIHCKNPPHLISYSLLILQLLPPPTR
jgi:hypothetical protein